MENKNIIIQDIDKNNVLEPEVMDGIDNHLSVVRPLRQERRGDILEVPKPFKLIKKEKIKGKVKKIKISNTAIVDINKGGYNSYLQNRELLGNIIDILNDDLSKEIEENIKFYKELKWLYLILKVDIN
ncbi:hypothetical protein K439DRAFT_1614221 [Ramaria rubella]|nr:hypothetical protein K439DRAFT_1614221 [Ramaria rubella]